MLKNNVLIFAENVVFPKGEIREGPFYVVVKQGIITKISKAESTFSSVAQCDRCDAVTCHLLAPGFVDIHNHGLGGGEDVLDYWSNPDYTCAKAVATGTTSLLASIVFPEAKHEETISLLKTLEKRVGHKGIGAVLEGIHAEGPLVCDFGGLPRNFTELDATGFAKVLDAIPTGLKMMTVSPHVASKSSYDAVKMLHERGVVPSLGHDCQAEEQEILDALSVSKTQPCHVTHLYNVSKFHHRNPGLVNFGLLDNYPSLPKYDSIVAPTVELIGDLIHVHPLAVKLVLSSRSWDQIAFVTDCIAHSSQAHKTITYNGREIRIDKDKNVVKSCDDNTLVGSCCTMLDIFKSLVDVLNVPVGKAFMMLSENPARFAKLNNVGTIEVGKDANLNMFNHNHNLMKTIVHGRMAFRTSLCRKKSVVSTESFDESFGNI